MMGNFPFRELLLSGCLVAGLVARAFATEPEVPAVISEPPIEESDRDFRPFQPVTRPAVPVLENDGWSSTSIDKFILQRLRSAELLPVAFADRATLLRRVTFDLTGLPPTPEEVREFLKDDREDAYPRAVDRLLASPAYGERWAQHWLDLVRFAETDGFEFDTIRPQAWRYRDWVIEAFNADLPYDQFVARQLAGDELEAGTLPASTDAGSQPTPVATGYLLAGPDMPDINSQDERRHIFLNGIAANVGEVFLGMRFGCAQCHHHRDDPISQHDFYRLRSFFETIDLFKDYKVEVDEPGSAPVEARVVRNKEKAISVSYLWIRGDHRRQGPEVQPQFPRVLANAGNSTGVDSTAGRRLALAKWLTARDQPLTARVMVNRLWQHHFGRGLVPTPSDFGLVGEPATHPELLDWLAAELMESGWQLKPLHRLMLTSSTYRLAAVPAQGDDWGKLLKADPTNELLGRMPRRRLEGESIRDALLAIAGTLNLKRGGPGVTPPLPPEVASTLLKNQWPVTKDESEHNRRSIYLFARRNLRLPLLEVFDKPDSNLSCSRRDQTTIAPQALHLLNSPFARTRAAEFAKRVVASAETETLRIELVYLLALGRLPSKEEVTACQLFLANDTDPLSAWTNLCHAMLNLNEFVYID